MDSVFRGTVTRVTGVGVFLLIPELGARVEYGPCQALRPAAGDSTGPAGTGPHTHPIAYTYKAGDRVLVTTVAGIRDDLVVLGRL